MSLGLPSREQEEEFIAMMGGMQPPPEPDPQQSPLADIMAMFQEESSEKRAVDTTQPTGAPGILREAAETIAERGVQRDSAEKGERSMARCVAAFNGLTGRDLTEKEGWFFMAVLKMARSMNGKSPRRDDFVDLCAYGALAGESVIPTPKTYATETTSPL